MTASPNDLPPFRIGEGWDIHVLIEGRPLVLGGVTIPHGRGLLGHSDADALLHAITDALLGAAGLGDIGRHFPDTDPAFRDADSAQLLAETARRVRAAGWRIGNIDATVVAQAPRLAPHIPAMVQGIARALDVAPGQVNVKAKTAERMGPVGREEAIEARAVALLLRHGLPEYP
jgi:2-C-methyl-D-erythritol 2,4-cyclodiphosphate synthase